MICWNDSMKIRKHDKINGDSYDIVRMRHCDRGGPNSYMLKIVSLELKN